MVTQILVLAVVAASSGAVAAPPQAAQVIADYLKAPYLETGDWNKARIERLEILARLAATPEEAVDAVRQALAQVQDPRRRTELVSALGAQVQTKKAATLLCEALKDSDEKVRWQAIHAVEY